MDIKQLLPPEAVFELREPGKERVLRELARRAAAQVGLDATLILKSLQKREDLGSTGLGEGVALPHARLPGLEQPVGLFAALRPAVPFDAIDDRPVDLLFLLLLPDGSPEGPLRAMACVARRLREPGVTEKLRAARGAAPLHAILIGTPG